MRLDQINTKQFEEALIIACTGESGYIDWQEVSYLKKMFILKAGLEQFQEDLNKIRPLLFQNIQ